MYLSSNSLLSLASLDASLAKFFDCEILCSLDIDGRESGSSTSKHCQYWIFDALYFRNISFLHLSLFEG